MDLVKAGQTVAPTDGWRSPFKGGYGDFRNMWVNGGSGGGAGQIQTAIAPNVATTQTAPV